MTELDNSEPRPGKRWPAANIAARLLGAAVLFGRFQRAAWCRRALTGVPSLPVAAGPAGAMTAGPTAVTPAVSRAAVLAGSPAAVFTAADLAGSAPAVLTASEPASDLSRLPCAAAGRGLLHDVPFTWPSAARRSPSTSLYSTSL